MPISKEQAVEIKKQLYQMVEKMPPENREQIKKYIESLNEAELEEFLKKNKIEYKEESISSSPKKEECLFCTIAKGERQSFKIAENKKSIVILELNPLSKGHSMVIPVKHTSIEEIPKSVLTLSQKIAKKIKKKLKSDDVKIESTGFNGHAYINVIPIYKDIPLNRKQADEKELKQIQHKLEVKTRRKRKQAEHSQSQDSKSSESKNKPEPKKINLPKVSFRIP